MSDRESEQFRTEIESGQRFEFGHNWRRFFQGLNEQRISESEPVLSRLPQTDTCTGLRFWALDLTAVCPRWRRDVLGPSYIPLTMDLQSTACTAEIRHCYFPEDKNWIVEQGSAIDEKYLISLGGFEIIHAWWGLHHTGQMRRTLQLAQIPVKPSGKLVIVLYNDQGMLSRFWNLVKHTYEDVG